jgi:site-specific DNA recombinase
MRAAIYTRFSTDKQSEGREGTIAQQIAIATECAKRHECRIVATYSDAGISGAALGNRPELKRAIAGAEAGEFEVFIVSDLQRLSRSQADLPKLIERLAFRGVRVLGAQDGFDSIREDSELSAGLHGIIGQQFRKAIAARTRAALKMKAQAGHRAGGKPYGYRCADSETGGRCLVIDETQSPVVREIFERYAAGDSLVAIASDLNSRRVPSPGAGWARTTRRADGQWLSSGINAILHNEIYRGEFIWNRSKWTKDPDSGRRCRGERPRSEWVVQQMPELRLVEEATWERVAGRCAPREESKHLTRGGPKYLFSGLLRCGLCGSSFVIIGGTDAQRAYGCSSHKWGGEAACSNGISVRQTIVESRLLAPIKSDLLNPEMIAELRRRVTRKLAERPKAVDNGNRIGELRNQVANLTDAIASGLLRTSPAIADRLAAAETELSRLLAEAEQPKASVVDLPAQLMRRYRKLVADLENILGKEPARARAALRQICGEIKVLPHQSGEYLVAQVGLSQALLKAAVGFEKFVVAGAGFEPATFGL